MRTIAVTTVISLLLTTALSWAKSPAEKIDALIEAKLSEKNTTPNPDLDDTVFLRRIYLDIAGRVPTIEEAEAFQRNESPDRRAALIDQLLGSEAYVSNAYHFWADILRVNREVRGAARNAYELWIKQALRENKPYDELVYDLVTADGKTWENGAIGYYVRDRGMPLDNMSNTVRIFLGTRLECAQCHNHPFDKWTQMDYFQMASFSYGMDTRSYEGMENRRSAGTYSSRLQKEAFAKATGHENFPRLNETRLEAMLATDKGKKFLDRYGMNEREFRRAAAAGQKAMDKVANETRGIKKVVSDLYNPIQYISVGHRDDRLAQLPHDYQYDDAEPKSKVPASAMFGNEITVSEDASKIEAYAAWMTSPENPTFTKVIANRLWKEAFGRGVFEPVDEILDGMDVPHPELMAYLEELMVDLDYDLKAFQRVLYNTRAYQREASTGDIYAGDPYHFPGPLLRRMSAEQMWDSIVALALPGADHYRPRLGSQLASIEKERLIYESLEGRSQEEFIALLRKYAPRVAKMQVKQEELRQQYYAARDRGDDAAAKELQLKVRNVNKDLYDEMFAEAFHLYEESKAQKKKSKGVDPTLLASVGMTEGSMNQMMSGSASGADNVVFTRLPKVELPEPPADLDKKQRGHWSRQQKTDYGIYTKLISGMARASELESPAPRGHFLREFGQSDREVIENAANSASVPQALNLMNSTIVEALVNRYSVFGNRIHAAGTPEDKTRMIFQAMLTREPTERELALVRREIEADGEAAYEGIVWALLNTQQFMFVQ